MKAKPFFIEQISQLIVIFTKNLFMPREFQSQVSPEVAANDTLLKEHVAKLFHVATSEIQNVVVLKRSIDARQIAVKFNITAAVYFKGELYVPQKTEFTTGLTNRS